MLRTDVDRSRDLTVKQLWLPVFGPHGMTFETRTVLISTPPTLVEMLCEVDDGAVEADIRDAIAAAALADDWVLADSLARQYGLVVCLRCATDMHHRPGWRAHRLIKNLQNCWGEICGSCAVGMLELKNG